MTPHQVEILDRRRERIQRLYLQAVRALAQVRRLQLPSVQINVGAQQVNVAGTPGG